MTDKQVRPTVLLLANNEFDDSGRTVNMDLSIHSDYDPFTRPPAKVIGDTSCLAGRQLKSCLKVRTQRASLAIKTQLRLPAYTPNIMETAEKVRFYIVEFREYRRVLSDNPSSSGPPIGIGWRYDPKDTVILNLDLYERNREGFRRLRKELAIPPGVREDMLREAGYSHNEITLAVRSAQKVKNRRIASVQLQKFDPILERVDTVKHGVKRIMSSMI
eukprot:CAMPEP_0172321784 /NCGR_PEP_ID=MMETSP1058-20130122/44300_1 /TAXON_ID=83371 /ORGANISM="Detonula confervacea, Strain CCMP 353" /LENGTH=216 /DNA_ID=CAMNT_0013037379 /DNA_START=10 /DNA_END=660 /DNA_ORIENTATION=+